MCHKKDLKFNDYKNCLMNNKKIMFKSERDFVSTIQMKKIALSNNDDRRLIDFNRITTMRMEQMLEKFVKMNY